MFRAIIVDDEPAGIHMLQLLIEKLGSCLRVVATGANAEEGIRLIEDYKPDIVFLDISMPGANGFELLERLSFRNFKLVFMSAHREFAIRAIRSRAFDYLLKPVGLAELGACLQAIEQEWIQQQAEVSAPPTLQLPVKDGILYIQLQEIIRLEASGSYTVFYLEESVRHIASKSIKEYELLLGDRHFFRCHNSHIVNLSKVKKFVSQDGFFALMCDGSLACIAKKQKDLFLLKVKNR
ncbi:MAG: response regulator transcription factor [Chitinophagaceae bacterium]|nr:response regulator transcription factor [Chitinophagaceae bacterium]